MKGQSSNWIPRTEEEKIEVIPAVCSLVLLSWVVGWRTHWGLSNFFPDVLNMEVMFMTPELWIDGCYAPLPHILGCRFPTSRSSLVAQTVQNLPAVQETWVRSLGGEDPLEEEIATHSCIPAWKIAWTEEPGGLQSTGSQRLRHKWATNAFFPHVESWGVHWCPPLSHK